MSVPSRLIAAVLLLWTATIRATAACPFSAFVPGHPRAGLPPEAASRVADFPKLLERLLGGTATGEEMSALLALNKAHGLLHFRVPDAVLAAIRVPDRPDPRRPLNESHFKRYGQEDRPIFAYKLAGEPGKPGGVYIYSPGESVGPRDFAKFLGPPHVHEGVGHISVVTQGSGLFYMEADTPHGKRLVAIPVSRGSVVLIPPDTHHTFWAGQSGNFDVASFTTELIAPSSPRFQRLSTPEELAALPLLPYEEFLSQR